MASETDIREQLASSVSAALEPGVFALASTGLGLVAGFTVGSVTAVMSNKIQTPMAKPHVMRMTGLAGIAGMVHGLVGAALIATTGKDSMTVRAISGCASGASVGIARKHINTTLSNALVGKPVAACGLCAAFAGLSAFEKMTHFNVKEAKEGNEKVMGPVYLMNYKQAIEPQSTVKRAEWLEAAKKYYSEKEEAAT